MAMGNYFCCGIFYCHYGKFCILDYLVYLIAKVVVSVEVLIDEGVPLSDKIV